MQEAIKLIRSRLYRLNIKNISNDVIETAIAKYASDGNLSDKDKNSVVDDLSKVLVPSEIKATQLTEPDFMGKLAIADKPNTQEMATTQASEMGVVLTESQVNEIVSYASAQPNFEGQELKLITESLTAFIEFSENKANADMDIALSEILKLATQAKMRTNARMVAQVSDFFRSYRKTSVSATTQIISAINSYKGVDPS